MLSLQSPGLAVGAAFWFFLIAGWEPTAEESFRIFSNIRGFVLSATVLLVDGSPLAAALSTHLARALLFTTALAVLFAFHMSRQLRARWQQAKVKAA